jgi:hypothetical protein
MMTFPEDNYVANSTNQNADEWGILKRNVYQKAIVATECFFAFTEA